MKKNQKKIKNRERDQFTVVLERVESKMDLMLEGHQGLREKFDRLEVRFDGLESSFDGLESKFGSLEHETIALKKGQWLTLEYLERIEAELHGEVKTKVDMKTFGILEKRVQRLENKLAKRPAKTMVR